MSPTKSNWEPGTGTIVDRAMKNAYAKATKAGAKPHRKT